MSLFLWAMFVCDPLSASTTIAEKIGSISAGKKIEVSLKNGTRLKGKLQEKAAESFLLEADHSSQQIRYEDVQDVKKAKSYKGWYIAGGIFLGLTIVMGAILGS